jgi:hypothetical protein
MKSRSSREELLFTDIEGVRPRPYTRTRSFQGKIKAKGTISYSFVALVSSFSIASCGEIYESNPSALTSIISVSRASYIGAGLIEPLL